MIVLRSRTNERGLYIRRASHRQFSECGQIGGGCMGGIMCPCKVPSAKGNGSQSAICATSSAAGKSAANLNAHAMPLLSSGDGQQGMSVSLAIVISVDEA